MSICDPPACISLANTIERYRGPRNGAPYLAAVTAMNPGGLTTTSNRGRYPGAADPSLGSPGPSMVMAFSGAIVVERDPDWTFRQLHDPATLLACVPGGSLTRLFDDRGFEARILIGVGPFRIAYAGAGRIVASNPRSRTASIALTGQAVAGMPVVRVRMSMAVRDHPRGSEISMEFRVSIAEARGLLGQGLIESIAHELVDHTINRMKLRLEDIPEDTVPAA
jgi:uncharacterized protein